MKTTRYNLQKNIERVTPDATDWLKDEFRAILESDKDFTRKADYIGLTCNGIDKEIAGIDEEIKQLQAHKAQLKAAKELALHVGAEVLQEYGIEKLEGAAVSSLTIQPESVTCKEQWTFKDLNDEETAQYFWEWKAAESALQERGHNIEFIKVKSYLNEEAVKEVFFNADLREVLGDLVDLHVTETTKPAKLKINKHRGKAEAQHVEELTEVSA